MAGRAQQLIQSLSTKTSTQQPKPTGRAQALLSTQSPAITRTQQIKQKYPVQTTQEFDPAPYYNIVDGKPHIKDEYVQTTKSDGTIVIKAKPISYTNRFLRISGKTHQTNTSQYSPEEIHFNTKGQIIKHIRRVCFTPSLNVVCSLI